LDSTGSGQGPVAGCCECGDEPSGSCATELVILVFKEILQAQYSFINAGHSRMSVLAALRPRRPSRSYSIASASHPTKYIFLMSPN
jgi:hypothetical protein